ncbi:hypothetical protein EDB81DRAFT_898933 [Dactylonectria macrodidyma]|uniref:BZIP domain-containing protein n=1 Tax=Dactylonectria macrodidyma TaxID=307937 RepID=A0A9P9J5A3_9HYPO|nr:hypothetical protein EDB81DRAFT_898933 [Dactylonectria macrodidyma]
MSFQPAMNQVADASSFDEAARASSMSAETEFYFFPCSSRQATEVMIPEDHDPSKAGLLTAEHNRKPKSAHQGPSKAPELEDTDSKAHAGDPHQQRIRKRNRIAATKCRLRKRDEAFALASHQQAIEDQNRNLSSIWDQLTTEIYELKTQLLRHTHCNCTLIQKYIAYEATKSVNKLQCFQPPTQSSMAPFIGYQQGSSGSGASASNSYCIYTPGMETIPPTWTNPSHQDAGSPEVGVDMFGMVLEPIQQEPVRVLYQAISSIPSMHEYCYQGPCVSTGPQPQLVPDGVLWGSQWEFQ